MYFAILGKHPELSVAELALVAPTDLRRQGQIVYFASKLDKKDLQATLVTLGGIVKRGNVVMPEQEKEILENYLVSTDLVGVTTIERGMRLKKEFGIKRFKLVDLQSSDLEVKQAGKEIVQLGKCIGLVAGRQDIRRFEAIDLEKPLRGMQVGMMPAKLTQMMINIGVSFCAKRAGVFMSEKRSEESQKRSEEKRIEKYDDKTSIIIGCAIEIHKKFHDTITELQFKKILGDRLTEKGFTVVTEKPINIVDNGKKYGNRFIDLEVDGEILIECKKTSYNPDIQKGFRQVRNYMELGTYPVGLFLNTGFSKLQVNRFNSSNLELTNQALQTSSELSSALTIYDPFVGFGTTGFVANSLGYHFIGSDINITPAKQNQKWWTSTAYADAAKHITLFKHDVLQPFTHPVLEHVDLIVTEGWLGPVVKKTTRLPELQEHAEKIMHLYEQFFHHIQQACPGVPVVITVPNYTRREGKIPAHIQKSAEQLGRSVQHIATYARKGQEVLREVWLLQDKIEREMNN